MLWKYSSRFSCRSFIILAEKFKPIIYSKLLFLYNNTNDNLENNDQDSSFFSYEYTVISALFVENAFLSSIELIFAFVRSRLNI